MSQIHLLAAGPESPDPLTHESLPHVLLVVDGFPKALGGGERIVLRLAEMLPAHGFRVSILTFSLHPESSFRPEQAPCPVYLLPLTKTYDANALRGAFALGSFLRRRNVRIVHTFFESSDLWAGLVTRLFSSAKLVWSRRDMGILREQKHERAYRALRRLPHAVIAVSQRVADHVVAVDGVPSARVHVVYNGLDLVPYADDAARQKGPLAITTIGNIRQVKGHDIFVQAAAIVHAAYPEVCFTVAGEVLEPEYFAHLQQLVNHLGLRENFVFFGKITDLHAHLQTAAIFVLPSRSEGFSNALIEAMAAGLPCVATDVGGNAEAISHGENGLIVPPEDAPALAGAMLSLLQDTSFAANLSIAARRTVERQFTADAMVRNLVDRFRRLLETEPNETA